MLVSGAHRPSRTGTLFSRFFDELFFSGACLVNIIISTRWDAAMIDTLIPTTPPTSTLVIPLHCTEGGSDKIYEIHLVPVSNGFLVNYRNGPRINVNAGGTKTQAPVDFAAAVKIMRSILKSKISGGYNPIGQIGHPVQLVKHNDTGMRPMLLEAVDLGDPRIQNWIASNFMVFQQKYNGERLLIRKAEAGDVTGSSRKGLAVSVSPEMIAAVQGIEGHFVLDGEIIDGCFYVWDLLAHMGVSFVGRVDYPYMKRLVLLEKLLAKADGRYIVCVKTARSSAEKRDLIDGLRQKNAEGFVIKDLMACYQIGRTKDKTAIKVKFWASLSAVVDKVNEQRSVGIKLLDGASWISVGNVTIPPNYAVPAIGSVIEVRYLYAYVDGSLFEPSYLGARRDIDPSDCLASQRKFIGDRGNEAA